MIRYPITLDELKNAVKEIAPTWLKRAKSRTDKFRQLGQYTEKPTPIWSEIKDVYMRLQQNKCAFCERRLEGSARETTPQPGETTGRIEHNIEHFRPKSEVTAYYDAEGQELGTAFPEGYHLLAYHLLNYATTCWVCNTERKRTYFPIAGSRISGKESPTELADEQPYLIYPLGDIDDDPETLITFDLVLPIPNSTDPHQRKRAAITIQLLDLEKRDILRTGRKTILFLLFLALQRRDDPNQPTLERERMQKAVAILMDSGAEHASCARSFVRLYTANPLEVATRMNEIFPP